MNRTVATCFSLLSVLLVLQFSEQCYALGSVSNVRGYIVLLKPKHNVQATVEQVARRTADPRDAQFAAAIDTRSVFGSGQSDPVVAGFRMFCDDRTAKLVAGQEEVKLVEPDSDISVDGY